MSSGVAGTCDGLRHLASADAHIVTKTFMFDPGAMADEESDQIVRINTAAIYGLTATPGG
jgi:hypothetical protein